MVELSSERAVRQRPLWARLLRFLVGAVVGATLGVLLSIAGAMVVQDALAGDLSLTASGSDISAHGGTRVIVVRQSGPIEQACNGACDDLSIENQGRGNSVREIRVLRSGGACVACREFWSLAITGTRQSWEIAGAETLRVGRADASR